MMIAVRRLADLGSRTSVEPLVDALLSGDVASKVEIEIIEALGKMGDPSVASALIQFLRPYRSNPEWSYLDGSVGADRVTVRVLGDLKDPQAVPELLYILNNVKTRHNCLNMAQNVIEALKSIGTPDALDAVVETEGSIRQRITRIREAKEQARTWHRKHFCLSITSIMRSGDLLRVAGAVEGRRPRVGDEVAVDNKPECGKGTVKAVTTLAQSLQAAALSGADIGSVRLSAGNASRYALEIVGLDGENIVANVDLLGDTSALESPNKNVQATP